MQVAVLILGIASTGMVSTILTVTQISAVQRYNALAEAEARRLAEKIKAIDYTPCADIGPAGSYDDTLDTDTTSIDANVSASLVQIQYWNGTYDNTGQPVWSQWWKTTDANYTNRCPTSTTDCGLQQITVHVAAADPGPRGASGSADITFLKRSDDGLISGCPATT